MIINIGGSVSQGHSMDGWGKNSMKTGDRSQQTTWTAVGGEGGGDSRSVEGREGQQEVDSPRTRTDSHSPRRRERRETDSPRRRDDCPEEDSDSYGRRDSSFSPRRDSFRRERSPVQAASCRRRKSGGCVRRGSRRGRRTGAVRKRAPRKADRAIRKNFITFSPAVVEEINELVKRWRYYKEAVEAEERSRMRNKEAPPKIRKRDNRKAPRNF